MDYLANCKAGKEAISWHHIGCD